MSAVFLIAHVVIAIIAIGPITVAASVFPRYVDVPAVAVMLHRLCVTYAAVGAAVPLLGIATAATMGVLRDAWVLTSIALTAAAALVLVVGILPAQRAAIDRGARGRLSTTTGLFNLLWVVVTILMIVRPGSSTGA